MADTRTTLVARFKTNLDTWISAPDTGLGDDSMITVLMTGNVDSTELTAYQELIAALADDLITIASNILGDFKTVLEANDNAAYARSVAYFDEVVSSMEVILKPIIRAVT